MNLYHFKPKGHGMEYFIMSQNKVLAFDQLIKHIKNRKDDPNEFYEKHYNNEYNVWKDVKPFDETTYPKDYTLEIKDIGEVIESEIC